MFTYENKKSAYFFDFDGVLFTYESDYDYIEYVESCLTLLWRRGCDIHVVSNNPAVKKLMPSVFEKYIDTIHHVPGEKITKIKELVTYNDYTPMECVFYDDTLIHIKDVEDFIDCVHVKSGELVLELPHIEFKFKPQY